MTELPTRAQQVLDAVQEGKAAAEIADELKVTTNAVYQQIGRLRRDGHLPPRVRVNGSTRDESLSVDDLVGDFRSRLEAQLKRIDADAQQAEATLTRLRDERLRVEERIAQLM